MIEKPGIYDVPEAAYHADTQVASSLGRPLSSTMAKDILTKPLKQFDYDRTHPEVKDEWDFGTAAHAYVLGVGKEQIVVVDAKDWRTKAAQEAKKEAQAAGLAPLLKHQDEKAHDLADAVLSHPVAGKLFTEGKPEQSIYWQDESTVTCKGRVDWLRSNAIIDLKTTEDAGRDPFAKSAANFGYHQQAEWYTTGVQMLTGERLPYLLVAVQKKPPYLLAVYQPDAEMMQVGRRRNLRAIEIYAEHESFGDWPGYPEEIQTLSLPYWYRDDTEEDR